MIVFILSTLTLLIVASGAAAIILILYYLCCVDIEEAYHPKVDSSSKLEY